MLLLLAPCSPFTVTFEADAPAENNTFKGPLVSEHMRSEVKSLNNFTKKTMDGLTREVPEDSLPILLDVKTHLFNVGAKHEEVRLQRDAAQRMLDHLRSIDAVSTKDADREQKKLDAGWAVWEDAHKQSPITKASIQPLVKVHGNNTKHEVEKYEEHVAEFAKNVRKYDMWKYDQGFKKGMEGLAAADKEFNTEVGSSAWKPLWWHLPTCARAHFFSLTLCPFVFSLLSNVSRGALAPP